MHDTVKSNITYLHCAIVHSFTPRNQACLELPQQTLRQSSTAVFPRLHPMHLRIMLTRPVDRSFHCPCNSTLARVELTSDHAVLAQRTSDLLRNLAEISVGCASTRVSARLGEV